MWLRRLVLYILGCLLLSQILTSSVNTRSTLSHGNEMNNQGNETSHGSSTAEAQSTNHSIHGHDNVTLADGVVSMELNVTPTHTEPLPRGRRGRGRRRRGGRHRDTSFYQYYRYNLQALLTKYEAGLIELSPQHPITLERLQEVKNITTVSEPYGVHPIQMIYYNNLPKNSARQEIMDTSLADIQNKTGVPFKRLDAKRGDENVCVQGKVGPSCVGLSGLAYSLLHILNQENVSDPTLVLEDDYLLYDDHFERLYEAMEMIPNDWDVVRFDCWGMEHKKFAKHYNPYFTNTTTFTTDPILKGLCFPYFCGGTHAMLWRGRSSSIGKLRQTFSLRPHDDVDTRITEVGPRFGLISYCMNIGLGALIKIDKELSDIPHYS